METQMNLPLLFAAWLCVVLGLIHSILGEYLIFRHLRKGNLAPTIPAPPLKERHIRILWASWHIVSLFGWTIAAILFVYTYAPAPLQSVTLAACAIGCLSSGLLVLYATQGKHPGWIALTVIGLLIYLSQ